MTMMKRVMPAMVTIAVLALIARRVPVDRLIASLRDANYVAFLAVMIPNTIVYFLWDTLILKTVVGWFHGDVPFRNCCRSARHPTSSRSSTPTPAAARSLPICGAGSTCRFSSSAGRSFFWC